MTTAWTVDQILALAPDTASVKSGKDLANKRKWATLGRTETVFWGECQGSAKLPYQAQLDLTTELGYKCNCPSRKLPCKHTLGLFLLFEKESTAFSQIEPPEWVAEWLKARQRRSEQQAKKREQAAGEVSDPAAQAKRAAERKAKGIAGAQDLRLWLNDILRQGLASMQGQAYQFWDRPAARLVDAQLPGLARQVRELATVPTSGAGWQARLLERLAKLHLQLEGFGRLETLPETAQADLRNLVGWNQNQDELLAKTGIADTWAVLGQSLEDQERLRVRRTWLRGQASGQTALLLHFAANNQPFDVVLAPGTSLTAELVFFPSAFPLRAIIRQQTGAPLLEVNVSGQSLAEIAGALAQYRQVLCAVPWLEEFPLFLSGLRPILENDSWWLQDSSGKVLPLTPNFDKGWQLLALSSTAPLTVFGQWDGNYFLPLSVLTESRLINLGSKVQSSNRYSLPAVPPWSEILTTALVGTDRKPCILPTVAGRLGDVLGQLKPTEDTTEYLLSAAAVLAQYGRAGQLPASLPLSTTPPDFATETLEICNEQATQHFKQMLDGTYHNLLASWLARMAQTNRRVPDEMLPALLEFGRNQTRLQAAVLAVVGQRGLWLASHNAQWDYVGLHGQEVLDETSWQTGQRHERIAFLKKLRSADPAKARELAQASWHTEKAEDRTTFLEKFQNGLSLADEPFLETALDDRGKEVRSVAAKLLARLPESALSQRMLARVANSLHLLTEDSTLKLDLELPAECTKEMQHDGIELKPPSNQAEKAFWLSQMLNLIPPGYWSEKLGRSPLELLEAAYNGEWFDLLNNSWKEAILFHNDALWAEAVTVFAINGLANNQSIQLDTNLLALLSPEKLAEYAILVLEQHSNGRLSYSHPAKALLLACPAPWSPELSRKVVESLRREISANTKTTDYLLVYLINEITPYLNPALSGEITEGWPTEALVWDYVTKSIEKLIALVQFRQSMLEALA